MKQSLRLTILFLMISSLIFPARAHAYLDPGTGSYLLQITAAVFFAGLFILKAGWTNIKRFFYTYIFRKEKHTSEKGSHTEK